MVKKRFKITITIEDLPGGEVGFSFASDPGSSMADGAEATHAQYWGAKFLSMITKAFEVAKKKKQVADHDNVVVLERD